MHNLFITQYFDWAQARTSSRIVKSANKLLELIGSWHRLSPPPSTGSMTNVEKRMNMFHLLRSTLEFDVEGDVVELGCHNGHSAVLMQSVIGRFAPERKLHVYDSFEGLPSTHNNDSGSLFGEGELRAQVEILKAGFDEYELPHPEVHKGWFADTLAEELPGKICFAHLDGDLYDSILVSLEYTFDRLSKGAVCLIDDYEDLDVLDGPNLFPGVKKACDEFFADRQESVSVLYAGHERHAYFRKL